ncbi:MAG: crotonase/enoyl-CoA hydratase family protein, partial [Alphaproteobacteria bacterium]|nr:crotonase/enoyl-CoA hydratase family protein [Alphaproteobacteria bacterium]
CVVLSGNGKAFCAGIDIGVLAGGSALDLAERTHGKANIFQHVALGWRQLPVPVIAALHGAVFGAGLQIALGVDIRFAAPNAELAVMETRWGIVPDMAGIALLRGLVRDDVARSLTYTARKVRGKEAEALGLVTLVVPNPLSDALALAHQIAATSPDAIRAAKRLFNLSADADTETILWAEAHEQAALLASANHKETIRAYMEKRDAVFIDTPFSD